MTQRYYSALDAGCDKLDMILVPGILYRGMMWAVLYLFFQVLLSTGRYLVWVTVKDIMINISLSIRPAEGRVLY